MTNEDRRRVFEQTVALLKPAFERVVSDPAFRARLEADPLAALQEVGVELDAETRRELQGKSFSEFWAERRRAVEGPVQVRDLPPDEDGQLGDEELAAVSGGALYSVLGKGPVPSFAPPYVPVGPVVSSFDVSYDELLSDPLKKK